MLRRVVAATTVVALGAVGAWLVLGNAYPDEGPYLTVTPRHGIHAGDVVILVVWLTVTVLLVRWARRRPRTSE